MLLKLCLFLFLFTHRIQGLAGSGSTSAKGRTNKRLRCVAVVVFMVMILSIITVSMAMVVVVVMIVTAIAMRGGRLNRPSSGSKNCLLPRWICRSISQVFKTFLAAWVCISVTGSRLVAVAFRVLDERQHALLHLEHGGSSLSSFRVACCRSAATNHSRTDGLLRHPVAAG